MDKFIYPRPPVTVQEAMRAVPGCIKDKVCGNCRWWDMRRETTQEQADELWELVLSSREERKKDWNLGTLTYAHFMLTAFDNSREALCCYDRKEKTKVDDYCAYWNTEL